MVSGKEINDLFEKKGEGRPLEETEWYEVRDGALLAWDEYMRLSREERKEILDA